MSFDRTNREIRTESLNIHGNCMEFEGEDTIIQLSNISLVTTGYIEPKAFPLQSLFFLIAGIMVFFLQSRVLALLGLFSVITGGIMIYAWYTRNERAAQLKKLMITINSGNTFTIFFQDQEFLKQVIQVLKNIISNPGHLSDVTFNIKDNTFMENSSVIQDYDEIHH